MEQDLVQNRLNYRFPVTDGYSLEVLNSPELASRLQSVLNLDPAVDAGKPVCSVQTGRDMKRV